MLAHYGKRLFADRNIGKVIICTLVILVLATILFFVYWLFVQPIASLFFPHNGIYEGVDLYFQENYLNQTNGEVFKGFLSELDFVDNGTVTYFCHEDNRRLDNLVYGNIPDVFILEIQLDEQEYECVATQYADPECYCGSLGDYKVYLVETTLTSDYKVGLAFHTAKPIVRCIMLTDVQEPFFLGDFTTFFFRKSSIRFD